MEPVAGEMVDHVAKGFGEEEKAILIKNLTAFMEDLARWNCYSTAPGQQSLRKQSARVLQYRYCTV